MEVAAGLVYDRDTLTEIFKRMRANIARHGPEDRRALTRDGKCRTAVAESIERPAPALASVLAITICAAILRVYGMLRPHAGLLGSTAPRAEAAFKRRAQHESSA